MSIPQLTTGKFHCFALRTWVSQDFALPVKLDDGLYASPHPPFVVDDWWKGQLGEIEINRITHESNLFLLALSEDQSADENLLRRRLISRHLSLFLQGVGYDTPVFPQGTQIFGENAPDGMKVRGLGKLDYYRAPPKVLVDDLSEEHLNVAAKLARGIDTIFCENNGPEDFLRLRKGFNAYLDGIKHAHVHTRLHQFVRALDAVIKPKQGDSTRTFKFRCQFFAGRRPEDANLLGELYELRSAAEHLNPLDDKLEKYPNHERSNLKALRTYQAELLAAFVYRKILLSSDIMAHFKTDQTTTDLWATRDANALISFWGDTVDLHKAPDDHFHDFL